MTLTTCRECKGQVSIEARICPHCGAPDPSREPAPASSKARPRKLDTKKNCVSCGAVIWTTEDNPVCGPCRRRQARDERAAKTGTAPKGIYLKPWQRVAGLAFIGLMALVVLSLMKGSPEVRQPTTKGGYIFCRSEADLDSAVHFSAVGDNEAAARFISSNPGCGVTEDGVPVYVEDDTWSGKIKVRPKGAVASFWTFTEAVQR